LGVGEVGINAKRSVGGCAVVIASVRYKPFSARCGLRVSGSGRTVRIQAGQGQGLWTSARGRQTQTSQEEMIARVGGPGSSNRVRDRAATVRRVDARREVGDHPRICEGYSGGSRIPDVQALLLIATEEKKLVLIDGSAQCGTELVQICVDLWLRVFVEVIACIEGVTPEEAICGAMDSIRS